VGTMDMVLTFMQTDQYAFLPDDWTRLSESLQVDFVLHIGPVTLSTGRDGGRDLHVCWDSDGEGWSWYIMPGQHEENTSMQCIGPSKLISRKSRLILKVDMPLTELDPTDFEIKLQQEFPHFKVKVVDCQDAGAPSWLKNRKNSTNSCRILLSVGSENANDVHSFLKNKQNCNGPFQEYAAKTIIA